eukprot:749684-Hanusia_phi.AAC.2
MLSGDRLANAAAGFVGSGMFIAGRTELATPLKSVKWKQWQTKLPSQSVPLAMQPVPSQRHLELDRAHRVLDRHPQREAGDAARRQVDVRVEGTRSQPRHLHAHAVSSLLTVEHVRWEAEGWA